MGSKLFGGEFRRHVVAPFAKLFTSVRESEYDRFGCDVPRDSPVSTRLDLSNWICLSKRNLCSSDASHILFRRGNVVQVAEDDIEVDRFSLEDMFPLGVGKSLWCSRCSSDFSFGKVEVLLEYGESLPRLPSILINFSGFCGDLCSVPR